MSKSDIKYILIPLLFIVTLFIYHHTEEKILSERNALHSQEKFIYIKHKDAELNDGLKELNLKYMEELEDYYFTFSSEMVTGIVGNDLYAKATAIGTNYLYPGFFGIHFTDGHFFGSQQQLEPVVVISSGLSDYLYGSDDTEGLTIELMGKIYTIVGIFEEEDFKFFMPIALYENMAPEQTLDMMAFANKNGTFEYNDLVVVKYNLDLNHYYLFEHTTIVSILCQTDNILLFVTGLLLSYYLLKALIKIFNRFIGEYKKKLDEYYPLQAIYYNPWWFIRYMIIGVIGILLIIVIMLYSSSDISLPMHWLPTYLFDFQWYMDRIKNYLEITANQEIEKRIFNMIYWNLLVVIPLYFIALSIMVARFKKITKHPWQKINNYHNI
ncbi:ABC transporter permease [Vallitalea okinawensis]|uniref:ABC transporter permease n=1 Tax=Vallitalea okinawensis TaxID=2078660 RepID=UPI000CFC41C7|nr:ABC transporter permease [Vallitalea okinawensis]